MNNELYYKSYIGQIGILMFKKELVTTSERIEVSFTRRLSIEEQHIQVFSFYLKIAEQFGKHIWEPRVIGSIKELLANAMDEVSEQNPRVELSAVVVSEKKTRWLEVTVSDTGPGFPTEMLAPRFFYTDFLSKKSGEGIHGGRGKGLFMLQSFVDAASGTLTLENKIDTGGAVVTFRIPYPLSQRS